MNETNRNGHRKRSLRMNGGRTQYPDLGSHHSMLIRIADITIALLSDDPKLKVRAAGVIKKFVVHEGEPDIEIKARWSHLSRESDGRKIFDPGALWQLYSDNGSYIFRFTSPALGAFPYKVASFNLDFTKGEVSINRSCYDLDQYVNPIECPLDEVLLASYLSKGGKGAEIHASGVVDALGRGHLFVGQSGAGKTTMARLWEDEPGIKVLGYDRIILRKMNDCLWMYRTPWQSETMLACPSRTPLTAVYFLEKGQKNELVAQKPTDSIGRLFACSFPPFYNRDALDFTLTFLEDVVKTVPCSELKFTPHKSAVEFIKGERFT
jgi:hypothetical protein